MPKAAGNPAAFSHFVILQGFVQHRRQPGLRGSAYHLVHHLAVLDDHKGRDAHHAVALGQIGLLVHVHLAQ